MHITGWAWTLSVGARRLTQSGDADTPGTLVMSNVLYLIGLFTFALLIGIVSDAVSEKVEDVRHGNHQVLERVRSLQGCTRALTAAGSPPGFEPLNALNASLSPGKGLHTMKLVTRPTCLCDS
jgi:hypothetical protein